MTSEDEEVSYLTLLKDGNFRRFFLAQLVSSLGDWIGVIAIAVFANRIGGTTGVGAVMTARVIPGFLVGPLAGVIADRWDRKRTMVVCDVARAGLIFSLPFVEHIAYLLVASMILESLTLIWAPAKDASLPSFVKSGHLAHANSLSLIAVYGAWPLASILFAGIETVGGFLGRNVAVLEGFQGKEEALALWVDSLTFGFSALMISTLVIASSRRRAKRLDFGEVKRDLVEGLTFVRDHKQVRPWMLGIGLTFTAVGAVISLGVEFVASVLEGGPRGFAFIIGFLATGMIIGLFAAGWLSRRVQKDVLFSSSLLLAGVALIAFGTMEGLETAIPIASAMGFFGGVAYSTGYSLIQKATRDDLRGRTFSAAYTLIRIGMLFGLGLFPFIASAVGNYRIGAFELHGTRTTLWLAGLVVVGASLVSMRAIKARQTGFLPESPMPGYLIVFEGGEGAGKSTQMGAFVEWLKARGEDVITTREPGGTAIGRRIRDVLLDPEAAEMEARTEALLYAADRAQHVAEVIRPALESGKVVISDRFVDSSLAYQGLARGLGLDEILEISRWATGGVMPDVVFFMKIDPKAGLRRLSGRRDRIEGEADDFHDRVGAAYLELARRFPGRFVVLDANRPQSEIHEQIVAAYLERTSGREGITFEPGTPAPPVPR
jgi:dTMP kinase